MNLDLTHTIRQAYNLAFDQPSLMVFSPGRINLIGEHTDYNQGFVLPAAIDLGIYLAIGRSEHGSKIISVDRNESFSFSIKDPLKASADHSWENYLIGVIELIKKEAEIPSEFNVVFGGDLPVGSGLSSSAALENAIGYGLNELFDLGLEKLELVKISQKAEHQYVGVECGIMDQFASMMGIENEALFLDCLNMEYESFAMNLGEYNLVLINSNVDHNLATSEYNQRKQECEAASRTIQERYPEVLSLRDVNATILNDCKDDLEEVLVRRCEYILEENERVKMLAEAFKQGNLRIAGQLLYEGHEGLRTKYEVSCPELDFLVDRSKTMEQVLGSRMMGGGFGGCTLNLVHKAFSQKFTEGILRDYEMEFGFKASPLEVKISDGVKIV